MGAFLCRPGAQSWTLETHAAAEMGDVSTIKKWIDGGVSLDKEDEHGLITHTYPIRTVNSNHQHAKNYYLILL